MTDINSTREASYSRLQSPRPTDTNLTANVDAALLKGASTAKSAHGVSNQQDEELLPPPTPLTALYRFATPADKLMLALGVLMAAANGALYPCIALVFGEAVGAFSQPDGGVDRDQLNRAAIYYVAIAVALFVTDYLTYVLFSVSAERQMKKLRAKALEHMVYMDVSWYDAHDALQLSSRITGDTVKIKNGMGQKLGNAVKYVCEFVAGYIIGFTRGWDVTLVMTVVTPVMASSWMFILKSWSAQAVRAQKLYAEAGAVAEETLSSIRTVSSLNAERRAIAKYNERTVEVEKGNIKQSWTFSIARGVFGSCLFLIYGTGLWYGGSKVWRGEASPQEVFQALMAVIMGTRSLGEISPNATAVIEAKAAAVALYQLLDTPSAISAADDDGDRPESCEGRIEAINVDFAYPSRPDAPVLRNYSVTIESGQTVAFVGASGQGKSTLIALLERFYDPTYGTILLDGRDIKSLNVKWLRSQIGLVSQEPVLFASSIADNIAAGRKDITRDQVVAAAKSANAHTFIMSLPDSYDTMVGEKGVSLSGGQKQRVAIARAVVREPKILVLDEATSALDAESERVVQNALNDLMAKTSMTTLVIAHRLSTVRHSDKIVVLSEGHVVEEGSHDELLSVEDGVYRKMYMTQEEKAQQEAQVAALALEAIQHQKASGATRKKSWHSPGSVDTDSDCDDGAPVETADGTEERTTGKFTLREANAMSRPERAYYIVGMIGTAVNGASFPTSAVLASELIAVMTSEYSKYLSSHQLSAMSDLPHQVAIYGGLYIGGAVIVFVGYVMQSYGFKYIAEKLTTRLRDIHFTSLCRQNIGFFDAKENATGALTADLATCSLQVSMITGESQGRLFQAFFTTIVALLISFVAGSWVLSLFMLVILPVLVFGNVFRSKHAHGKRVVSNDMTAVGAHASEVLNNIRTVISLGMERTLCDHFDTLLDVPMKGGEREAQVNGLAVGFCSFVVYATYAFTFWYGGKLVNDGDITFRQLLRSLMAIIMSSESIGSSIAYVTDADSAFYSGDIIMGLRDRKPAIDSFDNGGLRPQRVDGKIEFKDVLFRYPARPEVTVLKHYNLTIEAGQTVAFCGPSGGGKSTCISLLERFYDPVRGQVLLDGVDTKQLNVQWLRGQIGLVGQEPTLFIGSIAENIAYGLESTPSREEIEAAAKMANAHDFISQFPDGYDTQVGNKGEQLSGGQKQRIAIARAILKNPQILLLDEATSALDSESEKIVQAALDKVVALQRRTTIIIAHRLSTIRKADKICVVSGGKVAEQGTHEELVAQSGIYAKLLEAAAN